MTTFFVLIAALIGIGFIGMSLGANLDKLKRVAAAATVAVPRAVASKYGVMVLVLGLLGISYNVIYEMGGLEVELPPLSAIFNPGSSTMTLGLPTLILCLVAGTAAVFLVFFLGRAALMRRHLKRVTTALEKTAPQSSPESLDVLFGWGPFKQSWKNYKSTLVAERADQSLGWRASIPADFFFSREALIDDWLLDSFGRHLPGILTGLGIVGTFAGMLEALSQFDPSNTASAALGLKGLLAGVTHAFVASMGAISSAIVVTGVCRLTISLLQKRMEQMLSFLNGLFPLGAGENQLSGLFLALHDRKNAGPSNEVVVLHRLVEQLTQSQLGAERRADAAAERQVKFEERLLHAVEAAFTRTIVSSPMAYDERMSRTAPLEEASFDRAMATVFAPEKRESATSVQGSLERREDDDMESMPDIAVNELELKTGSEQRIVFSINRKLDHGFARIESQLRSQAGLAPTDLPEPTTVVGP